MVPDYTVVFYNDIQCVNIYFADLTNSKNDLFLNGNLQGWFDFKDWETDPNVEKYVDDMLQNSYRQWRNTMHIDYKMLKATGKDPLTSCPYDWIEQDEWKSMCDWFKDPIFKVIGSSFVYLHDLNSFVAFYVLSNYLFGI